MRLIILILLQILSASGECMSFDYIGQNDEFWKRHLEQDVYKICRSNETEAPYTGKYDKFYEKGIYYCACCGGDYPLYSSKAKFDSGTGWPSFFEALPNGVKTRPDPTDHLRGLIGASRIEVICLRCESHLGHVFDDGPPPTGKRYCMNSWALSFSPEGIIPKRTYSVNDKNIGE